MTRLNRFTKYLLSGVAACLLLLACQGVPQAQTTPEATPAEVVPVAYPDRTLATPAELPPLPYDYGALEAAIDAETMEIHHDRHHATYVDNLNEALVDYPDLQGQSVEALLSDLDAIPEEIRTAVRNNGGGHLNHTIFWQIMSPEGGGEPTGEIAQAIEQTFGGFEEFQTAFNEAGSDRFGSGWVWLVTNGDGDLEIIDTANQDSPIMEGQYPIMGNDVWEHAYYLRYQNQRAEYLENWWNVVNWPEIERRYQAARA
ncbi:superoxide dismutase [Nodosilinea sp. PGN35]|uniref:superoxide dismutase n=1 Tax=Nodosilinea sp. PGN35 TaxID=3020489 RepID=UPI002413F660|nr:superoxide dismutase [Nodosilinea sp. TSF1-S3]